VLVKMLLAEFVVTLVICCHFGLRLKMLAEACLRSSWCFGVQPCGQVAAEEIAVKPNVPAIQMEETIPMGVSEEQVTAPQDVLKPARKDAQLMAEAVSPFKSQP